MCFFAHTLQELRSPTFTYNPRPQDIVAKDADQLPENVLCTTDVADGHMDGTRDNVTTPSSNGVLPGGLSAALVASDLPKVAAE